MRVEHLLDEELVLVATRSDSNGPGDQDYVFVDWGPEFLHKHSVHFPDREPTALVASIGWLGMQHILGQGGSGYFPLRLVRERLDSGDLRLIDKAPRFLLPAYVVYPTEGDPAVFKPAVGALHQIAVYE